MAGELLNSSRLILRGCAAAVSKDGAAPERGLINEQWAKLIEQAKIPKVQ
jgi:hypothetical protein